MDPTDAQHLMIGGREVKETTSGPNTTSPPSSGNPGTPSPTDWQTVFDLGTQKNPGAAAATSTTSDPNNQLSAVDLHGDSAYVGYCGYCDTITQPVTASARFAGTAAPPRSPRILRTCGTPRATSTTPGRASACPCSPDGAWTEATAGIARS